MSLVETPHPRQVLPTRQSEPRALSGRVAIVTGSSRGIGRAIAEELAAHGAAVLVNYANGRDAAEAVVVAIRAEGGGAQSYRADVTNPDELTGLVRACVERLGPPSILVANAGLTRDRALKRMSVEEWQTVLTTNLDSVFYSTKAVLPAMIENGSGTIVLISSIVGQMGNLGQTNYAASKGGMIGFAKAAAQELARHHITVNAVCPGFVETDMLQGVPEDCKRDLLARIPLGRFGQPQEVAQVVRFLCAEGRWITGQEININGGMYM